MIISGEHIATLLDEITRLLMFCWRILLLFAKAWDQHELCLTVYVLLAVKGEEDAHVWFGPRAASEGDRDWQ